jgi:hypothetical protein
LGAGFCETLHNLAQIQTWKEVVRTALGMIFCLAALVILGTEVFWRTACEQAAEPPGVDPVLSSRIAYCGRSR